MGFALGTSIGFLDDAVTARPFGATIGFWQTVSVTLFNLMFYVSLVMSVFVYAIFAMLPLTILTAPIAAQAAARLTTRRPLTTLYGALVGLVVGWPLAHVVYDSGLSRMRFEIDWMAGASAAGALFAQPIWAWCIKPRIAPAGADEVKPPEAAAWLALLAACVVALILFG